MMGKSDVSGSGYGVGSYPGGTSYSERKKRPGVITNESRLLSEKRADNLLVMVCFSVVIVFFLSLSLSFLFIF